MGSSLNSKITYERPDPFVTPTIGFEASNLFTGSFAFLNAFLPLTAVPRETLHYTGSVIEDIMSNINREYDARGTSRPVWKKYKGGTDVSDSFNPKFGGSNLNNTPVIFFPKYIEDIQSAILSLISDSRFPDSLGSLMARIFGNNTTAHQGNFWSELNSIKNNIHVLASDSDGLEEIDMLSNIISGNWAIPNTTKHFNDPLGKVGVDIIGNKFVKNEAGSIETSDPNWPAPQIGKRVVRNGEEGIDGVDFSMQSDGRPGPFSRRHIKDTSQGVGEGQIDRDAGYSYFAHHPLTIQQVRYQPIIIERWSDEKIPRRHYVSNKFSAQSINLPWLNSQQVEKQFFEDWGFWLVKGLVGSSEGSLKLSASNAQFTVGPAGEIVTNCPFSLFFPPSQTTCSCSAGHTSYAIWSSNADNLNWNDITFLQTGNPKGGPKFFGPKTRLRVKFEVNFNPGEPSSNSWFMVGIRVSSIGNVNNQPFIPVILSKGAGSFPSSPGDFNAVNGLSRQIHSDGAISVNLQDAIKANYPQYQAGNSDSVLAIQIALHEDVSGSAICFAEDGPGGTFIPDSCRDLVTCVIGNHDSTINYIMFYEPPIENIDDPRIP